MKFGAINMEQFLGNFLRSMPGDALTQQWSHTIPLIIINLNEGPPRT